MLKISLNSCFDMLVLQLDLVPEIVCHFLMKACADCGDSALQRSFSLHNTYLEGSVHCSYTCVVQRLSARCQHISCILDFVQVQTDSSKCSKISLFIY